MACCKRRLLLETVTSSIDNKFKELEESNPTFYLKYYNSSDQLHPNKEIAYAIKSKDDSFDSFLTYADRYGMLDVFVYLQLFINYLDSPCYTSWFSEKMEIITDYQLILDLVSKYINSRTSQLVEYGFDTVPSLRNLCAQVLEKSDYKSLGDYIYENLDHILEDLDYSSLSEFIWETSDYISLCDFIWENLDEEYKDSILYGKDKDKIMGVWHLGLVKGSHSSDYLHQLEEIVFPYFIEKANELKYAFHSIYNETDYYTYFSILHSYFFELWGNASLDLSFYLDKLLSMSTSEVRDHLKKDFYNWVNEIAKKNIDKERDIVNENDIDKRLYLSQDYISQINKLVRIIEYFGPESNISDINNVKNMIPIYHLFLGKTDEAYNGILAISLSPIRSSEWSDNYIAAFYLCLLVESDEAKRTKLLNVFDSIYTNEGIAQSYLDIATDFHEFYSNWTKRIKREFKKDYDERKSILNALFNNSNYYDDYDLENFFHDWVINDKIRNRFKVLNEELKSTDEKVVSSAKNNLKSMIISLTSSDASNIRIDVNILDKAFSDKTLSKTIDTLVYSIDKEQIYKKKNELPTLRMLKAKYKEINSYHIDIHTIVFYERIKNQILKYWNLSESDLLCNQVILALKGLQSDPINTWRSTLDGIERLEDSLNNLVAYFLRGHYGLERVNREDPRGIAEGGKKTGELDFTILKGGNTFAIIESLRILKLNKDGDIKASDKTNLNNHLNKLLDNYDPTGVKVKILIVYAYVNDADSIFKSMKDYLKGYFGDTKTIQTVKEEESTIRHHKIDDPSKTTDEEIHVFTVLFKR